MLCHTSIRLMVLLLSLVMKQNHVFNSPCFTKVSTVLCLRDFVQFYSKKNVKLSLMIFLISKLSLSAPAALTILRVFLIKICQSLGFWFVVM